MEKKLSFNPAQVLLTAARLQQSGDYPEAERLCHTILNRFPRQPDALHILGLIADKTGDSQTALRLIRKAIKFHPAWAPFYSSLATVEEKLGRMEDAASSYEKALKLQPNSAETCILLGIHYYHRKNLNESIRFFQKAVEVNPQLPQGWNNLGVAFQDQKNHDKALSAFERALAINPNYADAHFNRGNVLQQLDRYSEAAASLNEALRLQPDYPEVWNVFGIICNNLRDPRAAECFRKAIQLRPTFAEAQCHLAFLLLLHGEYEEGWKQYEWRWRVPKFPSRIRDFPQPLWSGEELQGKRILLHAEQGLGDTIQFARYVPLVAARGGHVIFEVPQRLFRLFQGLAGIAEFVVEGSTLPPFDVHCPLMSLPRAFATAIDTIPSPVSLATEVASDRTLPRDPASPLRIGLVWAGSPTNVNDRRRSVSLAALRAFGKVSGASFYSLMKNPSAQELADVAADLPVGDLCSSDNDLADTAAHIQSLDLVITVDTSIAHLAGSMGKPVWILLQYAADWRWLLDPDDSPWYPSARLFRQNSPGDWAGVIAKVHRELELLCTGRLTPRSSES